MGSSRLLVGIYKKRGNPFFTGGHDAGSSPGPRRRSRLLPRHASARRLEIPVGGRSLSDLRSGHSVRCSALVGSPDHRAGWLLRASWWCWTRVASGTGRSRWPYTSMPSRAVVCGRPSGAWRPVEQGTPLGLAPWGLAAAALELFGARGAGMSDQGGRGRLSSAGSDGNPALFPGCVEAGPTGSNEGRGDCESS